MRRPFSNKLIFYDVANSKYYRQKETTLAYSASFEVEATPHQPLRSEKPAFSLRIWQVQYFKGNTTPKFSEAWKSTNGKYLQLFLTNPLHINI